MLHSESKIIATQKSDESSNAYLHTANNIISRVIGEKVVLSARIVYRKTYSILQFFNCTMSKIYIKRHWVC